ncbi:MAG: phosphoenolpyruvate carboxykinase (ATP) [Candidatus Moranbacteria bacterium]|nr:phosphoenolpyruvate carboxykinase (ATP) [Candidatus Moranbacteria bacterium]
MPYSKVKKINKNWTQLPTKEPSVGYLTSRALKNQNAFLDNHGALLVQTGKITGRSPLDKYVVVSKKTQKNIWWENEIQKLKIDIFKKLKHDLLAYFTQQPEIYYTQRQVGVTDVYALEVKTYTTNAWSALFTKHLFKDPENTKKLPVFKLYHAPNWQIDPKKYQLRSPVVIAICFETREIIIIGTLYLGEIKKSLFSVMNYLLVDHEILPIHASANQSKKNKLVSLFFGLSGTGKTTLSMNGEDLLIGDDEHGLSKKGVFNFEGGSYAKTIDLTKQKEPEIYRAIQNYSVIIENVKFHSFTAKKNFKDQTLTENGRASYSLKFLTNTTQEKVSPMAKQIFFLTADAHGVLPMIAILNPKQAVEYFLLGYTSKLAGTEAGVTTPERVFSPCFGAPFMYRHPKVYARLLKIYLKKYQIKVWLVNTGWTGGEYQNGCRFSLKTTRWVIKKAKANQIDASKTFQDPIFKLNIPKKIPGVAKKMLNPMENWKNKKLYLTKAHELANEFKKQLKKISFLD